MKKPTASKTTPTPAVTSAQASAVAFCERAGGADGEGDAESKRGFERRDARFELLLGLVVLARLVGQRGQAQGPHEPEKQQGQGQRGKVP